MNTNLKISDTDEMLDMLAYMQRLKSEAAIYI